MDFSGMAAAQTYAEWDQPGLQGAAFDKQCQQFEKAGKLWKLLHVKFEQEGILSELLKDEIIPQTIDKVLSQQDMIDGLEDSAGFLVHWHLCAANVLQKGAGHSALEWEDDFCMRLGSNQCCKKPLAPVPKKFLQLLTSLSEHSSENETRNFQTALRFLQFQKISPHSDLLGIAEDVKSCELNIKIQEYAAKMLPEYISLRDKADSEIARYYEHLEGPELQALRRFKEQFSDKIAVFNFESDKAPNDKQRKRFSTFKVLLENMSKCVDAVKTSHIDSGKVFLTCIAKVVHDEADPDLSKSNIFLNYFFKFISIFFAVINHVNAKCPPPKIGLLTPETWEKCKYDLEADAKEVRIRLASAANEAATRWLHSDISRFCYDVCLDTAEHDPSTCSDYPDTSAYAHTHCRYSEGIRVRDVNCRQRLAVDMHPDCQDLIGMRVWYLEKVPSGGFNQYLPAKRSTCGLIIVHVFLRYKCAIERLVDQPEKMQAPLSARNNVACGNIQLPSWVQDACVDRLFYQPLLDFLIHDFSLSMAEGRDPARLVFTGAAFDAVLATVVASELLFRFHSYREDRLIRKRHNHAPVDWDVLYNHIRTSVFVVSFMLPAVFSGPHLSPDQLITIKDKPYHTPHGGAGINMINITISNCAALKIVEYWLSVDRSVLATTPDSEMWKKFSAMDRTVLETLHLLLSCCKMTPDFEKNIDTNFESVKKWALSAQNPNAEKRKLGTFVADYKAEGVSYLSRSQPPMRLVNSDKITKEKKAGDKALGQKMGHAFTSFVQQVQQCLRTGELWLGWLSLIKEPFQLLGCSHQLPEVAHEARVTMDRIASWFLPIAAVYQAHQPQIASVPFLHRTVASYGTLNASDLPIHEHAYTTFGLKNPKKQDDVTITNLGDPNPGNKTSANFYMCSRMLVKSVGNDDRILVQWRCDSMDSHALIRNCYAVAFTLCFDPEDSSKFDEFDFQTEEISSSGFRITVTENDYESLYSLHCEAEIPIPRRKKTMPNFKFETLIDSTVIFVTMRMRFFSAQFGTSTPGFGPELFCFPKRISSPQSEAIQSFDDMLLFWVWFYLTRCRKDSLEAIQTIVNTHSNGEVHEMLLQNLDNFEARDPFWKPKSGCPPFIHFRKVLKLGKFYKNHTSVSSYDKTANAYDIVFCDFEKPSAEEKPYNSRYLRMRLDELIMQAWDFKLLALNSFGNNECLKSVHFPDSDALIQYFDEQTDLIATNFRSSWSSGILSKQCQACHALGNDKKRSSCNEHIYDYLNDDEEGLEYLRKQSSYLRRLTFSKRTFDTILYLFKNLQNKGADPNKAFFDSIADCIGASSISDTNALMIKLVSCAYDGDGHVTLMSQRSYDGLYNAFFDPPIERGQILEKGKIRAINPRFPIRLYDNERYMLGEHRNRSDFPIASSKDVPACSLVSRQFGKSHHFRYLFHVLETQLHAGWQSQRTETESEKDRAHTIRTEAEFTSWAHAMGVLRSFAIRKEFEAFCSFFQNAKERRSVLSWLRSDSESADPYLDCLQQIHTIFSDSVDGPNHAHLHARDDYHAQEERIIRLIIRHKKCGYSGYAEFKREMMSEQGRKSFKQRVSFLPGVISLERHVYYLIFRERSFWALWVTTFVCFMVHIHELRQWLMKYKRCIAAFGDQKVGKSRFWSNSLGIQTVASSQSNTVHTQMWMLPDTQFIDFPAFSEENKLGESYNFDQCQRCDIMARHIVLDFLLVPDICVYIVKTMAPNVKSIQKLIDHIQEVETDRYPISNGADDANMPPSSSLDELAVPRTNSAHGGQAVRTAVNHRLARESVLLCSHTQNVICRVEPVNADSFLQSLKALSFDPALFSIDKGNLTSEHLQEIGKHPELRKSRFVWVCGGSDEGHAVKIIQKNIDEEGNSSWMVVRQKSSDSQAMQPFKIWKQLRAKLLTKKKDIITGLRFPSKNVFLAYFAELADQINSPYDDIENGIEKDFPWESAFCLSTANGQHTATFQSADDIATNSEDLSISLEILNASESLKMILRKVLTPEQVRGNVIENIVGRPFEYVRQEKPKKLALTEKCHLCVLEDPDDALIADHVCTECAKLMCQHHAALHAQRKQHKVDQVIDEAAEKKSAEDFQAKLRKRDEEELRYSNSYTNRQKREKIWKIQKHEVRFIGQVLIDKLCGRNGLIDSVLKSLKSLNETLKFDCGFFDETSGSLEERCAKSGLGFAFWSYLVGDSEGSDADKGYVFSIDQIQWRSIGTTEFRSKTNSETAPKKKGFFASLFETSPKQNSPVPSLDCGGEDVIHSFIKEVDKLWLDVKEGGKSSKALIASIPENVKSRKGLTSVDSASGVGACDASSQPGSKVVPWFSTLFYTVLKECDCPNFDVLAYTFSSSSKNGSFASREFCLTLLKIILLPLLASKKSLSLAREIRAQLQFGVSGDEFYLSLYHFEKAMMDCLSPSETQRTNLFDLLSIQPASEDHSMSCINALSLLIRSIPVKDLVEVSRADCLDFQPCIAALICENMFAALCENRSVFAMESSRIHSDANESALHSLTNNVLVAFKNFEQCILKPFYVIRRHQRVSKIEGFNQKFQDVFENARTLAKLFNNAKESMLKIIDGSFAAVSVTISARLLNGLEDKHLGDDAYCDIPLMGRTVNCSEDKDVVRCYLTAPSFCFFTCALHRGPFQFQNRIEKEMHFLRISLKTLRELQIQNIAVGEKFTFIISNCSTVFFEELQNADEQFSQPVELSRIQVSPRDVLWAELSDPEIIMPLRNCRVELELEPVLPATGQTHFSDPHSVSCEFPSKSCIVGQRIQMNVSFHLVESITFPTCVSVVLDDDFEYTASGMLKILPFNQEVEYAITKINTTGKSYQLMEVLLNEELLDIFGIFISEEQRVTFSFPATNPSGERLYRKACFVYLRNSDQSSQVPSCFSVEASRGFLGFGIAETPVIHRMPLNHCEILISKACLGETSVKLLLSFECSIQFLIYDPDSGTNASVEIDLPKSWSKIAADVPQQLDVSVTCSGSSVLQAKIHGFSHTKICVKLQSMQRGRERIYVEQNTKCSIVVSGVALPPPPPDLNHALLKMKEANEKVAQKAQSQSDDEYEQHKLEADAAISKLNALKESLTCGCSVTIKDAKDCIVMTGRNVPMSPLLESTQYAAVIERRTFENSEFRRAHDGPAGNMPWNYHEGEFWIKLMQFLRAFVAQRYQGNASIINSDKIHSTINNYYAEVNVQLSQHRDEGLTSKILQQYQSQGHVQGQDHYYNVLSRAVAMAIQLWSSDIAFKLDDEYFRFYQIMNRWALSEDSRELLEEGGISLVKAIKRNITTARTDATGTHATASGAAAAGAADVLAQNLMPTAISEPREMFFRGASVPFEMAGFFFPGKIFKFPVFVATSCKASVAVNFALQVPASERTIWKFLVRDDCMHFKALKDNALLPGEEEFLFAPYSAFEVKSNRIEQIQYEVKERGGKIVIKSTQLRVICLVALSDNRDPRAKDVPTAPRY